MFSLFYLATQSPSFSSSLTFYTVPDDNYTMLTGDQFYLNCTAGGRYGIHEEEKGVAFTSRYEKSFSSSLLFRAE